MLKRRQNLPLRPEARPGESGFEAGSYQFDRDLLLILIVRPDRAINRSHPALSDFFDQLVGAEAPPQPRVDWTGLQHARMCDQGRLPQEIVGLSIGSQQRLHILAK